MPPAVLYPEKPPRDRRSPASAAVSRCWPPSSSPPLGLLIWSEADLEARAAFVLTWGFLNFFWLALLRRPLTAAALSLAMIVILIVLSQFKHAVLMMTATFVDVMIIDLATFSFLMNIIPGLAWKVGLAVLLTIIRAGAAVADRAVSGPAQHGGARMPPAASARSTALSFAVPTDREDEFDPHQYVSKFARSAAVATVDLMTRGVLEADAAIAGPAATGRRGSVPSRPQAAAHRHGVRRIRASTSP